jgi:hypothetical protein
MTEASVTPLRLATDKTQLSEARKAFIKTIREKQEMENEFSEIIPFLQELWMDKILCLPRNNAQEEQTRELLYIQQPEVFPNFKHYLYNYTPQLLVRAINKTADYRESIESFLPYFKKVVQDMRKKDIQKENTLPTMVDATENKPSMTTWGFTSDSKPCPGCKN